MCRKLHGKIRRTRTYKPLSSSTNKLTLAVGLCSVSALPVFTCSQSPISPSCASKPKTKKIMYDTAENDDFDREQIATYEEVGKLYPRPGMYRPIVLIGAPGVGRNELRRRLMDTDPDKYRTPVPCKLFVMLIKLNYTVDVSLTRLTFRLHG